MTANFDIKIGFILKEMIKMARVDKTTAANNDIKFIDIVDLLKSLLEENNNVSILKTEIVFYVFEYLLLMGITELQNCSLVPSIVEILFNKYLKKRDFEGVHSFCKYLSRKFESIHHNRVNKKAKFILNDTAREDFKMYTLYSVFLNDYYCTKICAGVGEELPEQEPDDPQNSETGTNYGESPRQRGSALPELDEDTVKSFLSNTRNFVKILTTLGLYDKKVDSFREIIWLLRSPQLLQSMQAMLAGVFSRFRAEDNSSPEGKSLKAITEQLCSPVVSYSKLRYL